MNTANRRIVKASSVSRAFDFVILIWLALLLFGIVEVVISRGRTVIGFMYIGGSLVVIPSFTLRRWIPDKCEQRRQRAAAGDQSFLALEQIIPDATALSIPTTVAFRSRWQSIFVLIAIAFLLLVLLLDVPIMFIDGGLQALSSRTFLTFLAIDSPVILIPTLLVPLLFFLRRKNRLEVSESGLTMYGMQTVHHVSWNEAQLFAIYAGKAGSSTMLYELSSANDIVRWTWLRKYSNFSVEVPAIPFDEYNHQMQSLLSFIAAKTKLPLYDLRQ